MKTALSFAAIVIIAFAGIYMLFNQNSQNTAPEANFLTPSPTSSPSLSITPQAAEPTVSEKDRISADIATIRTVKGNIVVELYPNDAPKTVTNFATHSKNGFYDNLTFHRVEDWVIQGGDPNGNGTGGTSIYGPTFEDELNPNTPSYKEGYVEGVLAMANRGPNTNSSQFFILKTDYPLDHNYTIFGKVTSGMEVVKKISAGDKILGIDVE